MEKILIQNLYIVVCPAKFTPIRKSTSHRLCLKQLVAQYNLPKRKKMA